MQSRVYFIRSSDGRIKIGRSTNVAKRLKALQTAHGSKLDLIGSVPGGGEIERSLHERWSGLRISGEWFDPTPEMLSAVNTMLRAPELPVVTKQRRTAKPRDPERERIAKKVIAYFRTKFPQRTAACVSEATGIPAATVSKWFDRVSAPSAQHLEPLIIVFGPTFLATICPTDDLPVWLQEAIAIERAEELMASVQTSLAEVRKILPRPDFAAASLD